MIFSVEQLRQLSAKSLAALGAEDIAFVKQITVDGRPIYGVYSADGTRIAAFDSRELAFAAVRQNDLEPVSVH